MTKPLVALLVVAMLQSHAGAKSSDAALARAFAKGTDVTTLNFSGNAKLLDQVKYVQAGREPGDSKDTYALFIGAVARQLGTDAAAALLLYGERVRPARTVAAARRELDARADLSRHLDYIPNIWMEKKKLVARELKHTSEYLKMGLSGDGNFIGAVKEGPITFSYITEVPKYLPNGQRDWSALPPRVQPVLLVTRPTPSPAVKAPDAGLWSDVKSAWNAAASYVTDAGESIKNKYYVGKELVKEGFGYVFVRGKANWGVTALVDGLRKIAAYMRGSGRADTDLHIGDLSSAKGGQLAGHLSHRKGVDVDLAFYITDPDGKPVESGFVNFTQGKDGLTGYRNGKKVRFDVKRNWYLLQAIMANDDFEPTRIFVAKHLEDALLAEANDDSERARAKKLLGPWPGHEDHFHLRIKKVKSS